LDFPLIASFPDILMKLSLWPGTLRTKDATFLLLAEETVRFIPSFRPW
jgi:hypothetical protein